MIYSIENNFLKVSANDFGAELMSIFLKENQEECLWQGNPDIWSGRSPILFPNIGKFLNDRFRYNEKEYEMPKHGFARHSEFTLKNISDSSMTFSLCSNDATKKCFPFDFELLITYSIDGHTLTCTGNVINRTKGEMYFSIGAHPAFNCQIGDTIEFEKDENLRTLRIDENAVLMDKTFCVETIDNKKLIITKDIFNFDALILHDLNSQSLTLESANKEIKFTFGKSPYLGIWAKPGAPYVCIEPWYGVNDQNTEKASIAQKLAINRLSENESFTCSWTAQFSKNHTES